MYGYTVVPKRLHMHLELWGHCKNEITLYRWQILANCSSAHCSFCSWADNWTTTWDSLEVRCSHVSEFWTIMCGKNVLSCITISRLGKSLYIDSPFYFSMHGWKKWRGPRRACSPRKEPESLKGCVDLRPPPSIPAFHLEPVVSCSEQGIHLVRCHVIGVICQHWLILLMSKLFIQCKAQWK